jgi:hypothetical protein
MISLLIFVLVLAIIYWLVSLIPLNDPFPRIIQAIFIGIVIWAFLVTFQIVPGSIPVFGHISL